MGAFLTPLLAAVLTAAHCCLTFPPEGGVSDQDAWQVHEGIRVVISAHHLNAGVYSPLAGDGVQGVTVTGSARIWVHPGYVAISRSADANYKYSFDVCVIDLKGSVPENVQPASLGDHLHPTHGIRPFHYYY